MTIINQIISYKLSGISYAGNSAQLNYTAGVSLGVCVQSKALVVDENRSITNINTMSLTTLNASSVNGTISSSSAAQTNITSLGTLTSLSTNGNLHILQHNGTTTGLILGSTLVTASGTELNYNDISTTGVAQANKTLVLDSSLNIIGINALTAVTLNTTNLSLDGVALIANANQINYNNITTPGIAQASRTLVLNSSSNITNINSLSATTLAATTLTGTISTASQPNITSLGTLSSLVLGGAISGVTNLSLSGTITGATNISATNLTGTIQTSSQPSITSLGTLSNLTVTNNITTGSISTTSLTVDGTNITTALSNIAVLSGINIGQAVASKALVVDASRNIGNINGITTTSITATNISGIIQTTSQPNITSLGSLTGLVFASNSSITNLTNLSMTGTITGASNISATTLSGLLTNPNQTNITSVGTLSNLLVSGNIGLGTTIPSRKLEINSANGSCLRLSFNAPTGSATNFADFTLDTNNNLSISTVSGNVVFNSNLIVGSSTSPNHIIFAPLSGNNGDTYITERIYSGNNTELLLFNGNTIASVGPPAVSPDRIRLRSGEIRFQIYPSTETYSALNDNNNALIINSTGRISINSTSTPTQQLEINNASGSCLRLINNNSNNFTDINISSTGWLNIKSTGNYIQIGDVTNNAQTVLIGTSASNGTTGTLLFNTSSSINTLQSGIANTSGSSQDFAIIDYGTTVSTSTRKIMFKAGGNVGIGTEAPDARLEINDSNGVCLRLSFNAPSGSATQYCTQSVSSAGLVIFNAVGTTPSFAFRVDGNQTANISAILTTAAQPNITSLGTLTSLNISGNISSVSNIIMSGTITGATNISATTLTGILTTVSQPNITTLGTLGSLSVSNRILVGSTAISNTEANDLLYVSSSSTNFIGLRLENRNAAASGGTSITFTGFNTNVNSFPNWELARIACLTTDSNAPSSYQFGSLAFYVRGSQVSTNATEAMRLASNGFLGINTTNPTNRLSINGTTNTNKLLVGTSTDSISTVLISALDSTINNNTSRSINIGKALTNNNQFEISYKHVSDGSSNNCGQFGVFGSSFDMSITTTGVGIGTETPTGKFEINQAGDVYGLRLSNGTGVVDIGTSSAGELSVRPSGNILLLGSSANTEQGLRIGSTLSSGSTGILNIYTTSTGNYIQSAINTSPKSAQDLYICDYVANSTASDRKIVFKANGNVGFGQLNPSRQLEINSITGDCLRLAFNGNGNTATSTNYCDQNVSNTGIVDFIAGGTTPGFRFTTSGPAGSLTNTVLISAGPNHSTDVLVVQGGSTRLAGNLIVGVVGTGTVGAGNRISFAGTFGDVNINHTVIAERIYATTESSELLLFKGNDIVGISGPDRIRMRSAEFRFQTFTAAEDFSNLQDNNDRLTIANNGFITTSNTIYNANLNIKPSYMGAYNVTNNVPITWWGIGVNSGSIGIRYCNLDGTWAAGYPPLTTGPITTSTITTNTITTTERSEFGSTIRVTGANLPTSGAGIELAYLNGIGNIYSFDRSNSLYKELRLNDTLFIAAGNSPRSVTIHGAVVQTSDYRLKKNILNINYGINEIKQLRPVKYSLTESDNKCVGFIAHEIQALIPELVYGIKDDVDDEGNDKMQAVNYSQLTAVLVKGMQEQSEQIEALQDENKLLKEKLDNMQQSINLLLQRLT